MSKLETINKLAVRGFKSGKTSDKDLELQRIIILSQPFQLNEDQKIVLEWLKSNTEKHAIKMNPIAAIYSLHRSYSTQDNADVFDAYEEMSMAEEAQVLEAFSKWALEQVANDPDEDETVKLVSIEIPDDLILELEDGCEILKQAILIHDPDRVDEDPRKDGYDFDFYATWSDDYEERERGNQNDPRTKNTTRILRSSNKWT
jgi:hypothetical protein